MIYDHRTYICKYGMVPAHIALSQRSGFAVQRRHLGEPVLYATTEVGDLNSFVHIWAYADLADRAKKRAALAADPEWKAFVKASQELGAIVEQHTKILLKASLVA